MTDKEIHADQGEYFCWDFTDCPESIRSTCPVYIKRVARCWERNDTRCSQIVGFSYDCEHCRYFRWRSLREALDPDTAPGKEK